MMLWIALRSHRGGFVATASVAALSAFLQADAYHVAVEATPGGAAAFGRSMEVIGRQISYLLPLPVGADTLGGYVQWRAMGFLPLVLGVWAVMAGTGAVRGEEERGLVEQWIAAGVSRGRLVATRLAAFVIAAGGVMVVTTVAALLGAAAGRSSLPLRPLLLDAAALLALASTCFAIGMMVAQLAPTRRSAGGWATGLLLTLFFLNSLGRTVTALQPFRGISPFYYGEQTNALAPGGTFDLPATVGLALAAIALTAVAAAGFRVRDMGAPLLRRRQPTRPPVLVPSRNPVFRLRVLADLYEQRLELMLWVVGISLLATFFASLARTLADLVRNNPLFAAYVQGHGGGNLDADVIGIFWFGIFPLLLAAYAITQVARWAQEDAEGRLEMVLATPTPRWRVVLERALELGLGSALLIAVGSSVTGVAAASEGIGLSSNGLLRASLPLLPLALAFGAVGGAVTGRFPRSAVGVLSGLAMLGYFIEQLKPLFRWPDWVGDLSVFTLYGSPMTDGIFQNGLWALIAVTFAGFGLATLMMQRREVGT